MSRIQEKFRVCYHCKGKRVLPKKEFVYGNPGYTSWDEPCCVCSGYGFSINNWYLKKIRKKLQIDGELYDPT